MVSQKLLWHRDGAGPAGYLTTNPASRVDAADGGTQDVGAGRAGRSSGIEASARIGIPGRK